MSIRAGRSVAWWLALALLSACGSDEEGGSAGAGGASGSGASAGQAGSGGSGGDGGASGGTSGSAGSSGGGGTSGSSGASGAAGAGGGSACATGLPGVCGPGKRSEDAHGPASRCLPDTLPAADACGNGVDEDCDGDDLDCGAATLFVDNVNGSDNNDGTAASPLASLEHAVDLASTDTVIYVQATTTGYAGVCVFKSGIRLIGIGGTRRRPPIVARKRRVGLGTGRRRCHRPPGSRTPVGRRSGRRRIRTPGAMNHGSASGHGTRTGAVHTSRRVRMVFDLFADELAKV
jgi:hypothetical protein